MGAGGGGSEAICEGLGGAVFAVLWTQELIQVLNMYRAKYIQEYK